MKKIIMIIFVLLVVALASGCAAKIGGTSIKPSEENSLETIRKVLADNKTIYYKIVFCESGWMNWSIVKEPVVNPDEITKKAGEIFAQKAEYLFRERGFIMKRTDNFSSAYPNVQIEIRISAREMQKRTLFVPTGEYIVASVGTRWFVYYRTSNNPLELYVELYDYQLISPFKETTLEEMINGLITRIITSFLD